MKQIWLAAFLSPISLIAFSTGPPIQRAGVPSDGGLTCVACHRTFAPADSDPRGSVRIAAASYTPGVSQKIQVTISHPDQKRWGFQLVARYAGDTTKQAGTFSTGTLVRVRCQTGHDAPCADGELQYAEHNLAQVTDPGAGFTYTVDWTPPANSVGDIVFYAAGNAANGDGTLNGDRIYTTNNVISPATCNLPGPATLSAAVSAASYTGPVSPNSLVALFGTGFQPAGLTRSLYSSDVATNTLPLVMSCMAVEFNRVRAPVFYSQPTQANVVVPTGIQPGQTEVRVVLNPNSPAPIFSSPITVLTAATSPALFTADGQHAVAQFSNTNKLVTAAAPAKPGDLVTFYATGLGGTTLHLDAAALATAAGPTLNPVTVTLNGTPVPDRNVFYAGNVPGTVAGLCQINVLIPPGVADGDASLTVTVNGASSPGGVTVALAAK